MELKHKKYRNLPFSASLLIVPYGIETPLDDYEAQEIFMPFNRTLWN